MKFTNLALAITLASTSTSLIAAQSNSTTSIAKIISDGLLVQNNIDALIRAIENQILAALSILQPGNSTTKTTTSTNSVTSASVTSSALTPSITPAIIPFISTPGTLQLMYPGGQMGYYGNFSNFGEIGALLDASQALQVSFLTSDGTCAAQAGGNAQLAIPGAGYLGITTGTTYNGYLLPVSNSSNVSRYDSVSNFTLETTIFAVDCNTGALSIFIDQTLQGQVCLDGNDGSIYVLGPGLVCDPSPGNSQTTMTPYFIPTVSNANTTWIPYKPTTSSGYFAVNLADGNTTRSNNSYFQMLWYSSIALVNVSAQASTITLGSANGTCSSINPLTNLDLTVTINVNISTPTVGATFDMPTLGYFGIYTTLNSTLNANNTGYMGAISQESAGVVASAPYANTTLFGQTQFVQLNCTSRTLSYFFNGTQVFPYGQYQLDTDSYVMSYYATKNDTLAALYGDSPWVNTFVPFSPTFWS